MELRTSDDAPLGVALGLPCLAVFSLYAWVQQEQSLSAHGWAEALLISATLLIYGVDRWKDRGRPPGPWLLSGMLLLGLQLAVLVHWWLNAGGDRIGSLLFFLIGQSLAISYAGFGPQGKGLKHLPAAKGVVVALAVGVACAGMGDAFGPAPDPIAWWSQARVLSCACFVIAIAGCNAQLFDLRDLEADRAQGVPSTAVLWGAGVARGLAGVWLLLGIGLSLWLLGGQAPLAGFASRIAGLCLGLWQLWDSRRPGFASRYFLTLDGALVVPWLVALIFRGLAASP